LHDPVPTAPSFCRTVLRRGGIPDLCTGFSKSVAQPVQAALPGRDVADVVMAYGGHQFPKRMTFTFDRSAALPLMFVVCMVIAELEASLRLFPVLAS
jgi:hypothetical protein